MEVPRYLQILWAYKWLVALGLLVAAVCGFLSGYRIVDGSIESKAETSYEAATTVLVSAPSQSVFRGVEEIPVLDSAEQAQAISQPIDLTKAAAVYAYIIAGDDVRSAVERRIGDLRADEDITAIRRTTQPAGDERFPGREELPVIDIIGTASSEVRAEQISRTAKDAFFAFAAADQERAKLAADERVGLSDLRAARDATATGSNPMIPVLLGFIGVFIAFMALIYVFHGVRSSRADKGTIVAPPPAGESATDELLDHAPTTAPVRSYETVGAGASDGPAHTSTSRRARRGAR